MSGQPLGGKGVEICLPSGLLVMFLETSIALGLVVTSAKSTAANPCQGYYTSPREVVYCVIEYGECVHAQSCPTLCDPMDCM